MTTTILTLKNFYNAETARLLWTLCGTI